MLRYYEDEVRILALRRERLPENKAVGLGCWFRRWLRAVKGTRIPAGLRALQA